MTVTVSTYAKQLMTVLSASMGGFVLGIATAIGMVNTLPISDGVHGWIPQAEYLGFVAGVGCTLAVVAWVYIDYRYVDHD